MSELKGYIKNAVIKLSQKFNSLNEIIIKDNLPYKASFELSSQSIYAAIFEGNSSIVRLNLSDLANPSEDTRTAINVALDLTEGFINQVNNGLLINSNKNSSNS